MNILMQILFVTLLILVFQFNSSACFPVDYVKLCVSLGNVHSCTASGSAIESTDELTYVDSALRSLPSAFILLSCVALLE